MHLSELVDMRTRCTVYDQFSYMLFWRAVCDVFLMILMKSTGQNTLVKEWSCSSYYKCCWSNFSFFSRFWICQFCHSPANTTQAARRWAICKGHSKSCQTLIPWSWSLFLHDQEQMAVLLLGSESSMCALCKTVDCKTSQEERGEAVTTNWKNHFSFWGPSCCCLWHAPVVTFICTKTAETLSQWLICPNRTKILRSCVLSSAHVEKSEKTFLDWNGTFSNSSLMGGVKWDDTHSAASLPISMASFTVATPSFTMTESVSP